MITITELFPRFSTCNKWLSVFREINPGEDVRLEKEYTIHVVTSEIVDEFHHMTEKYFIDKKLHKTNGPAVFVYYEGDIQWKEWWFDGKRHRTDGPAEIGYYQNGSIQWEVWWVDDKRHRTDGPADVGYYVNGDIANERWYVNGEICTVETHPQRKNE